MSISFGRTLAADIAIPPLFESFQSVPDDRLRLVVRCDHPRRGPTRIAKVSGGVIRTLYIEDDYPGASHEWVVMDCEGCLRSWRVHKASLKAVIDSGVKKVAVRELTDKWTRLPRLDRP